MRCVKDCDAGLDALACYSEPAECGLKFKVDAKDDTVSVHVLDSGNDHCRQ